MRENLPWQSRPGGFPLDFQNIMSLNTPYFHEYLLEDLEAQKIFTKDEPFGLNELFYQKDLGRTLERIANKGWQEFYMGKTADMIIQCMKRTNGLITKDDLMKYRAVIREPIVFDYRGYYVYSMPPASSGGITLALILNQLEKIDFQSIPYHSADHIHYL